MFLLVMEAVPQPFSKVTLPLLSPPLSPQDITRAQEVRQRGASSRLQGRRKGERCGRVLNRARRDESRVSLTQLKQVLLVNPTKKLKPTPTLYLPDAAGLR